LVDVYRPEVRERSKALEGAHVLRIGTDKPRKAFEGFDRSTPVYLYCGDGRGSAQIAKILEDMGFSEVNNLKGGLKAWIQAGRSTVTLSSLAPVGAWPSGLPSSPEGESTITQSLDSAKAALPDAAQVPKSNASPTASPDASGAVHP
jgi:rhodanese-related sulfurtransferase